MVRKYANSANLSEDAMWLEGTRRSVGYRFVPGSGCLKVARTIADIDRSDIITRQHFAGGN